ncbi:MAG: DNA primase [Fidelibacterota bacterium]|nr:MAG: DNA primase [Candidatus Neomarinimicrobiota bacterium]
MARIPEETINRIRDAADILDVVSGYVQLKRRGRNWFGLCPFHQEKTPSFSINQQKQIFHCFGCGRGGNAITFVMELEKLEFVEAVQRLGERYGIPVELSGTTDPRRKATVQQVLDLCELAADSYRKNLQGSAGAGVRAYLEQRGITGSTQALFKIGYALPGWDHLLKAAGARKFSHEALNQSGLFIAGDKGPYDRFRSRIMFPITNIAGRVVAFGGRVFESDDPAKYVNSPETPVYRKGEVLYGLSLTRDHVRETETAIIVEGYLDLIQLYQAGIKNIVAVSGTALTERHARELRKLTGNVFLAYDGDDAGVRAAVRGGYTLLRGGLSPRVVNLPPDLDPDDWVRKEGPEPFLKAVADAGPLLEFHLSHFQGDLKETGDMRRFLDEILQELVQVPDPLVRELHLKKVADLTGVDERRLHETLQRIPRVRVRSEEDEAQPRKDRVIIEPTRSNKAQLALISLAFHEDDRLLNLLLDHAREELFTHPVLKNIWRVVVTALQQETIPEPGGIMDKLSSDDERQVLSQALMSEGLSADEAGQAGDVMPLAIDCLTLLHRDALQRQIDQRRQDLRRAEQQASQPPADIVAEVAALQRRLADLGEQFNKYRGG